MDSILISVKKMLGIDESYKHFDPDIIMHINSVFSILTQLGVGDSSGFIIEDSSATWDDFIDEEASLQLIKSYMFLKVKMIFDPPTSSAAMESMNKQISEYEWRINVTVDPSTTSS